jgi:hypothetical protein
MLNGLDQDPVAMGASLKLESRAFRIMEPAHLYALEFRVGTGPWARVLQINIHGHGPDRYHVRISPAVALVMRGYQATDHIWNEETYQEFMQFVQESEARWP